MDKQQAKNIIEETFEKPFDKNRFINFIKNLLNSIEEAPFAYHGQLLPEAYRQYISTLERIGKFNDGENRIDILVIKLQRETSLERARTNQRNFVAGYLQGKYGSSNEKEAALVAFVSPDNADWRFSLVKMDHTFKQTPSGKMKVKKDFTPARRWSFLVGVSEKSHTAQRRLVDILANDEESPTLAKLEEAFNIESVTKEFFIEYRNLFLSVKEALDAIIAKNATIKNNFEENGVNTVDFAKKLLGQIIFLYFLQKKGWFGVERDTAWGTGSKQFLRELFQKKHGGYNNFFNDILEPLFYDALSRDRSDIDHWNDHFKCKIPFLNGGLFDPMNNYDWVHTDILIPNELFSNAKATKEGDIGDGILDVFDRYNFTVKEDEPLEKEVAIDPELLGKAYEKFNAIRPDNFEEYRKALKSGKKGEENKFNKQFGVYYTPREIVHYMCQQSLINYLSVQFNGGAVIYEKPGDGQMDLLGNDGKEGQLDLTIDYTEKPVISKEDIEILIHSGERLSENEEMALIKQQRINEGHQKTSDYKLKLPESIHKNAKQIDEKLSSIKVCDPAIGSGAFPVGMMGEIIRARNVLSNFIKDTDRTIYNFKRECIENSLYGVDIDTGAVEIAKLRLWLSLVVDEDDIKNIKPLPNLDYKIVCGNSLTGVEKNLFNEKLFTKLEEVKPFYFNETNPTKKQVYKKQIDGLISKITNGHSDFDFEVYFSEVFHKTGGFDVIMANPPYLRERDNKNVFEIVNKSPFGKKYHQGKMDYWFYFLHKAIDLAKQDAIISYITSRYWLNSSGAKKLINRVAKDLSFIVFVDIGKLKVFEEVAGHHMVAVYRKSKTIDKFIYKKLENNISDIEKNENTENVSIKLLSNKSVFKNNEILVENSLQCLNNTVPLGDIIDTSIGVQESPDKITNKHIAKSKRKDLVAGDGVFVLNAKEFKLLNPNKSELKVFTKYLDPNDVFSYGYNWSNKYLIYSDKFIKYEIKTNKEYSNIKKHLDNYKEFITSSNKPYGLHRPREIKYFTNPKIIFKGMFVKNSFAYDENKYFVGFSFSLLIQKNKNYDLKYILSILNSKFALDWFYKNGKKRGAGVDIGVEKLRLFPIKIAIEKEQKHFINLVDKILFLTQADDYPQNKTKQAKVKEYEKEIDQMVYKLYDLTEEEINIIEGEKK
jgi:hypothetical protein